MSRGSDFRNDDDFGREPAIFGKPSAERFQLPLVGEFPFEQQVADFLEMAVIGQLVDIVSAIDQAAFQAIHQADGAVGRDHPFEPFDGGLEPASPLQQPFHEVWSCNRNSRLESRATARRRLASNDGNSAPASITGERCSSMSVAGLPPSSRRLQCIHDPISRETRRS